MSKRKRQGNGRFAIVPSCAFNDSRLTAEELATLGCLATWLNNQAEPWWPINQQDIADIRGTKRETVNRHVRHLVELGYIWQRSQNRASGGQIESLYFMNMNVEVSRECLRSQVEEQPEPQQSDPEPSPGVILEARCDPPVTPLSSQDHTPVIVESPPRDPAVTPIRNTDHRTDHFTDQRTEALAPTEIVITQEPDPDKEPNLTQLQVWCKTAGKIAYAPYLAARGYWAYSDAIKCWRQWRDGLRIQLSRAHDDPAVRAEISARIRAAAG